MRIIRDIEEAKSSLLKRLPLEFQEMPPRLKEAVNNIFSEELTLIEAVEKIIREVRAEGDSALRRYTNIIDGVEIDVFEVSKKEIERARAEVNQDLISALELASERVLSFHLDCRRQSWIDFSEGGLGQLVIPLERAGMYVPGGSACYPSTVLMTVIPAKVAGVDEIIIASPPGRDGKIPSPTLVAADICRADRVFKIGGAQAIAALAFGTESIPKVDKICGPGNIFVQLAKKLLFGIVGIDGIYGPTETIVVADETASPSICAIDLLAQAEHDPLSSAILITTSAQLAKEVDREVKQRLKKIERKEIASAAVEERGGIVVVQDIEVAIDLVNYYAPEHLSLLVKNGWSLLGSIRNAGGIFVGETSPEILGDYIAGPSHVMPTGGTARFSSPLSVDDFIKITSVAALNEKSLNMLGPAASVIAEVEGLSVHAQGVRARLQ